MTYLAARGAASRPEKSAASCFSCACNSAGLKQLNAQGIHKGRVPIFKENGADPEKSMAILSCETHSEAAHYSQSADLIKTVTGVKRSNSLYRVGVNAK